MRDGWGEPSGEPRPDYRDAVEPDEPIEHEGKPARGERVERPADDGYRGEGLPDLLVALGRSIERAKALRDAATCDRCGAVADHTTATCCSAHSMVLCHKCYRRTHFVEVCGCALCIERGEG